MERQASINCNNSVTGKHFNTKLSMTLKDNTCEENYLAQYCINAVSVATVNIGWDFIDKNTKPCQI